MMQIETFWAQNLLFNCEMQEQIINYTYNAIH